MDYEKKYKELTEQMKQQYDAIQDKAMYSAHELKRVFENILPTLKESEDDKKRKFVVSELRNLLETEGCQHNCLTQRYDDLYNAIKWVENQQNAIWDTENKNLLDWIIKDLKMAEHSATVEQLKDIYNREIMLLERIMARGFWKPTEEQMNALDIAISDVPSEYMLDEKADILETLYAQLKELKEEK